MGISVHVLASLKTALRAHVLANPDVAALVGTAFHDMPSRNASPPFLAFGNAVIRDDSSLLSEGAIVEMEVLAVTHERGTTRGLNLVCALEAALKTPLPPLVGHRLIALEQPEARVQHDADKNIVRASLRLRAFTESL